MYDIPSSIAACSGQQLHILSTCEADSPTHISTIRSSEDILDVTWNHNGQVIAICHATDSIDNSVALYSASSGELVSLFGNENLHNCQFVRFAGRSRLLCCTCIHKKNNRAFISIWDLKRMIEVRRFEENVSKFISSSLDQSDKFVYCLAETNFSIYLLKENKKVGEVEFSSILSGKYMCFDSISTLEQNLVALGDSGGTVTIYDLEMGLEDNFDANFLFRVNLNLSKTSSLNERYESDIVIDNDTSILQVSFSGELLAILMPTRLLIYNWLNQVVVAEMKAKNFENDATASSVSWDGSIVALGFSTGKIVVLDWRTQRLLRLYRLQNTEGNSMPVKALAFSPQVDSKTKDSYSAGDLVRKNRTELNGIPPKHIASSLQPNNAISEKVELSPVRPQLILSDTNNLKKAEATIGQQIELVRTETTATLKNQDRLVSIFSLGESSGHSANQEIEMTINHFDSIEGVSQLQLNESTRKSSMTEQHRGMSNRLIDEELFNSFRTEIKQEIVGLHMEMLRQFQIQSDDMKSAMSKQLDILERIADENQSLRHENQRLRELLDRSHSNG